MAAPTIRGSTAPVLSDAGTVTSPSATAIGDLLVFFVWSQGTVIPSHTVDTGNGFVSIRSHSHDDGTTDGRLTVAYKIATSAGANSYTPLSSITNATAGQTTVGVIAITAGTYEVTTLPVSNSTTSTSNAVPNPPSLASLTGDWLILAIGCWHVTTAGATTATAGANYTIEIQNASTSHVTHLAVKRRALTALSNSTEDPPAFGDNVVPNGTVGAVVGIRSPNELTRAASLDGASGVATAGLSVRLRSAAISGTSSIAAAGEIAPSFSTFERSAALSSTSDIAAAGLRVHVRSAAISSTAAVTASGQRSLVRSAEVAGTGDVVGVGLVVRVRSALLAAASSVIAAGLRVHVRSAALATSSAIVAAGSVLAGAATIERSAAISGTSSIAASGGLTIERSAALSGSALLTAAGAIVRERSVSLEAAGSVSAAGLRVLQRSAAIAGVGRVLAVGRAFRSYSWLSPSALVILEAVTTPALIRDRIITVIQELAPTSLAADKFRVYRDEGAADFRAWAEGAKAGALRRFQVRDTIDDPGADTSDTLVEDRLVTFEILVAYPQTARAGSDAARDRDRIIREDQNAIENAVGLRGYQNFAGAHPNAAWISGAAARDIGDGVDFLVIRQTMRYYLAV